MDATVKHVPWSYSKIKNFETCPRKHYFVDIAKKFKDESDELAEGERVHRGLANYLRGKPLPPSLHAYAKWADEILALPGELLVEQKYAITSRFKPASFYDNNTVWLRSIADVLVLDPPNATLVDWKTGKRRNVDEVQLALMALCVLVHYREVKINTVKTKFIYLADDSDATEIYDWQRLSDEILDPIMVRVEQYQHAIRNELFPATPGKLCASYCPVTSCPHNGRR